MGRAYANGLGDHGSIPGPVIPKTQKIVSDAALLNTQHLRYLTKLIFLLKLIYVTGTSRAGNRFIAYIFIIKLSLFCEKKNHRIYVNILI